VNNLKHYQFSICKFQRNKGTGNSGIIMNEWYCSYYSILELG